jgi:hypothetical protein
MMSVEVGKLWKGNDEFDHAMASPEAEGEGLKVTVFPEPGSQYNVYHNVPRGKNSGEFSKD